MADMKKFLDQSGVSTLWGQVKAEIAKIPTYDDAQVKADIAANAAAIEAEATTARAAEAANAKAISDLAASVTADIATAVAGIVGGADTSFDTLKEIADWIADHPESVAELNSAIADNASDIAALAALVGETSVAAQISDAISKAGHAAAADLTAAVARIAANEGKIASLEADVAAHGTRLTAVETKATNNEAAIASATARIDGLVAGGGEPNLINVVKVNGVAQAITDKAVDIQVPVVQALTAEEIKAACV